MVQDAYGDHKDEAYDVGDMSLLLYFQMGSFCVWTVFDTSYVEGAVLR